MENPHPAPPPAPAPEALGEEQALSGSPAVEAVNGALRALSKAARAFTLYEPRNEAIRRFIADFRERMEAALRTCGGPIVLTVQPFELQLGSEPVYAEKDRERSLSFRLFRDGVRKLTFPTHTPWEDFLRLLEILSVRFIGVRQQEDDLVTLLTKARFQALTFEAVEGFAEQEDDEEDPEGVEFPEGAAARSLPHVQAPPEFDLPLPPPAGPMVGITLREVPPRYLEALRAEETPETVPARAVRLVAELVSAAEAGRLEPAELSSVAAEVRDFLVADRRLDALARWVRLLQPREPGLARALAPLFEPLGRREVLDNLFEAVPQDAPTPHATIVEV
ncbi:MAG TPA: hypothetical protein VLQ93_12850, partial [Myxococcaceae bacterium]|nr:hypothetical protein [Myxococcaceae bacterium]